MNPHFITLVDAVRNTIIIDSVLDLSEISNGVDQILAAKIPLNPTLRWIKIRSGTILYLARGERYKHIICGQKAGD